MFPRTSDILLAIFAISALFVALFAGTGPSHAATFSIIAQGHSMTLDGPIKIGDAARLDQAYRTSCKSHGFCPERLFLDSQGGRVSEGYRMANQVYGWGMHTVVRGNALCFSSCFFIFSSGAVRAIFDGSVIGVHSMADDEGRESIETVEETRKAAKVMEKMGVPASIIAKMLTTPPSEIAYLTWNDVQGWVQLLK